MKTLQGTGIRVVVLGISPMFRQRVPLLVAERLKSGLDLTTSDADLDPKYVDAPEAMMRAHFTGRRDVAFVSLMELGCPAGRCLLVAADETPLYYDIAHLTPAGSRHYAKLVVPLVLNPDTIAPLFGNR